jgi:hypothetical protein
MITVTTTIRDETLTPYLEKRAAVHQKALRELFVAIYIADEDANQAYNRVAVLVQREMDFSSSRLSTKKLGDSCPQAQVF